MSHMMQKQSQQGKGALQLKEISIIPITAAAASAPNVNNHNQAPIVVEKASSSNQSMAADDDSADSLRKKRCTDRYDSSESSDRYVSIKYLVI